MKKTDINRQTDRYTNIKQWRMRDRHRQIQADKHKTTEADGHTEKQ